MPPWPFTEITTSPDETCGVEPPIPGRFSRIQFAATAFDSFAPLSSSKTLTDTAPSAVRTR